ncbi:hypothetical protein D3C77_561070 [compost metagenome]
MDFLKTADGRLYVKKLIAAAPDASPDEIFKRAYSQIASGSTIPKIAIIDSPLVKIVPMGQEVTKYSPFFTTMEELQAIAQGKKTLADAFGLPLISEAPKYSIFEIKPINPTEVFISTVAPTAEFGGSIGRAGGAAQYLIPDRNEWLPSKLIGTIDN